MRIVTFLVTVVADNQGRVFAPQMSLGARRIDTSGRDRVFVSFLSVSVTLLIFLLFLNIFIGNIAIFRPQEI